MFFNSTYLARNLFYGNIFVLLHIIGLRASARRLALRVSKAQPKFVSVWLLNAADYYERAACCRACGRLLLREHEFIDACNTCVAQSVKTSVEVFGLNDYYAPSLSADANGLHWLRPAFGSGDPEVWAAVRRMYHTCNPRRMA